jgi:hypothetical protein
MEGQETANKYNVRGGVWSWEKADGRVEQTVAIAAISYSFSLAEFPASRRESDWVLKLGPPLG